MHDSRAQTALWLVKWWARTAPDEFFYLPPLGHYVRRARLLAMQLVVQSSISVIAAARKGLLDTQQLDIARVAAAIDPIAARCARKFRLEPDELKNETLVRVLPSIRRSFRPPSSDDDGSLGRCLERYVSTSVYRTAYVLRYSGIIPRRRRPRLDDGIAPDGEVRPTAFQQPLVVGDASLGQVEDDMNFLSEVDSRDELAWLIRQVKVEQQRRLESLRNSLGLGGTSADAARDLGMKPDAMRRWIWDLRRRLKK